MFMNNLVQPFSNLKFILPKVNTDYIRQAHVVNIDNIRLIKLLNEYTK